MTFRSCQVKDPVDLWLPHRKYPKQRHQYARPAYPSALQELRASEDPPGPGNQIRHESGPPL